MDQLDNAAAFEHGGEVVEHQGEPGIAQFEVACRTLFRRQSRADLHAVQTPREADRLEKTSDRRLSLVEHAAGIELAKGFAHRHIRVEKGRGSFDNFRRRGDKERAECVGDPWAHQERHRHCGAQCRQQVRGSHAPGS